MPELRPIAVFNGHPALLCTEAELHRLFQVLDEWGKYRIPNGEISIALLTDEALARLHQTFLDDPASTDVITFPAYEDDNEFAGEICVSVDTAIRAAEEHQWLLAEELSLYIIHGWLHLSGLGDKTPAEAAIMRQAESEAMDRVRQHNSLPCGMTLKPDDRG